MRCSILCDEVWKYFVIRHGVRQHERIAAIGCIKHSSNTTAQVSMMPTWENCACQKNLSDGYGQQSTKQLPATHIGKEMPKGTGADCSIADGQTLIYNCDGVKSSQAKCPFTPYFLICSALRFWSDSTSFMIPSSHVIVTMYLTADIICHLRWYWELHVKLPKCAGRQSSFGIQWNLSFSDFPFEWELLVLLTAAVKHGAWEPRMSIFSPSFCCVCWFASKELLLFMITITLAPKGTEKVESITYHDSFIKKTSI